MAEHYMSEMSGLSHTAKVFINSQFRLQNKKRAVWTEQEKALSLAMFKSSPKGYRFLAKIFTLPSIRTLRRFLSTIYVKIGICEKILNYLSTVSENLKDKDRYCTILFDEVSLMPNLAFNKCAGVVEGLQDFGCSKDPFVADHALVFMLRGINSNWKQPFSYYLVRSATKGPQLKNLIVDNIRIIHDKTKFKVVGSISDQGTANVGICGR